jgi:hypothetical protein
MRKKRGGEEEEDKWKEIFSVLSSIRRQQR